MDGEHICEPPFDTLSTVANDWNRLRDEGLRAKEQFRYQESSHLLLQAWKSRPQSERAALLAVELSEVLAMHLARFEEALQVLAEAEAASDPASEDALSLQVWRAKTYFHRGDYRKAESLSREALDTFAESGFEAAHYWTAVFYLFYALCRQDKSREAKGLFLDWERKTLHGESELSLLIKLQLRALILRSDEGFREAEQLLLQVLHQCARHFPTSMLSAINLSTLGILCHVDMDRLEDAETYYQSSEAIYAQHFPLSLNRAKNFCNLAVLYSDLCRGEDAEAMQLRAHSLLQTHYPDTQDFLNNLVNLAMKYRDTGKTEDAIRKRLELHDAYLKFHPEKLEAALNLCHLAELYEQANRQSEAETQRIAAEQKFFSAHHPTSSQRADNLMNLGILYYKLNRREAAEEQHRLAHSIYEQFHSTSADTAVNLLNWGVVYHNTGRLAEAEQKYRAANAIYEQHHPHIDNAALCAFNLGLLYEVQGRAQDALQSVSRAVAIWTQNASEEAQSRGLPALARLQKQT